jgi:hypothetical protein
MVKLPFIFPQCSGGPWTSAVQGAKKRKIFFIAKNARIAEKKRDLNREINEKWGPQRDKY